MHSSSFVSSSLRIKFFDPVGIPRMVDPSEVVEREEISWTQSGWTIAVHFSIESVSPIRCRRGLRYEIMSSTWSAVVAMLRSSAKPKMNAWGWKTLNSCKTV